MLSLRVRLTLVLAVMVLMTVSVGVASLWVQRGIQTEVSALRSNRVDLSRKDLDRIGLEVEGVWDPSNGWFVATGIETLPGMRRPKLRGAIQDVDRTAGTLRLFGVDLHVDEATEFLDASGGPFTSLRPGQRIEVTCDVRNERWRARKIRTGAIKASDKIKGTVTAHQVADDGAETLGFHDLTVALVSATEPAPQSALHHIRTATELAVIVQECRTAAHELVGRRAAPLADDSESDEDTRAPASLDERLVRARSDLAHYLSDPLDTSASATARWRSELRRSLPVLERYSLTLAHLASSDRVAAEQFLGETFDPFLEGELRPLVYAYLGKAEEELEDHLRAIAEQTDATTRIALFVSLLAGVAAIGCGALLRRSITRPLRALHEAAQSLGAGELDTRVEVRRRDELGDLGAAFNRMAARLASTTVSIDNLENVFGSMSAALLVLSPERRITAVNRAACDLLRFERGELMGRTLDSVCRAEVDAPDHLGSLTERHFVRRDGTEVVVAFSQAELRRDHGTLGGYVCMAQDLTERKRIEEQVRNSLAEKELLLREVHHRVKNNMQVISSMLAMQSSTSDDPVVIDKIEQSQTRIRSMALIHEQLYRSADLAHIDFGTYLDMLVQHLEQSFGAQSTIVLALDEIELNLDQSLACGLIVNELVTNAFQHAFRGRRAGTVRVELRAGANGYVELSVADDGRGLGPAASGASSQSLGMSLVETLAQQLRGQMRMQDEDGVTVSIRFPRFAAEVASA